MFSWGLSQRHNVILLHQEIIITSSSGIGHDIITLVGLNQPTTKLRNVSQYPWLFRKYFSLKFYTLFCPGSHRGSPSEVGLKFNKRMQINVIKAGRRYCVNIMRTKVITWRREEGGGQVIIFSLAVCFAFLPAPGGVSYGGVSWWLRIEEIRLHRAVFIINWGGGGRGGRGEPGGAGWERGRERGPRTPWVPRPPSLRLKYEQRQVRLYWEGPFPTSIINITACLLSLIWF